MSEVTVQEVKKGKWSWDETGFICTYTFPTGETESFDTSEYPGAIRQQLRKYGSTQKLADGAGGKDKTVAMKRANMRHIHGFLRKGYWKDPAVEGKGGIKKADFDAATERANRLGAALETERTARVEMESKMAKMAAVIEKLTMEAAKRGRK